MKKSFSMIIFLILMGTGLYALPLSAGFGLDLGFDYTEVKAEHRDGRGLKAELSYAAVNYGFSGFFDAKYVMAVFGMTGVSTWVKTSNAMSGANGGIDPENIRLYGNALVLGVYGKFPFEFDSFSVYPILGMELKIMLSLLYAKDSPEGYDHRKKGDSYQGNAKDWTSFWGKVGVGADFYISDSFFIRGELIFGIKPPTAREELIIRNVLGSGEYKDVTNYGIGFKATIAIGFNIGDVGGGGGGGRSYSGGGGGGSYGGGRGGGNDIYYPR